MKDLYKRLGIEPQSSAEEVAAALGSKPELGPYAGILLDPERRAQYDETYHIVKTIGMLRNRLGLDTGHSWFLENCPDFAPRKSLPFAQSPPGQHSAEAKPREEIRENPPLPTSRRKPAERRSKALFGVLGIVGLAAVVLLVAWLMR